MENRGLRALPPSIWISFAASFALIVSHVVVQLVLSQPWGAMRYQLTTSGLGFVAELLALVGALELARRLTGRAALGMRVVTFGFVLQIAIDVVWALLLLKSNLYEHEWVYKTMDYVSWATWLPIPIGLAIAVWDERRALGIAIVVVFVLTWPPRFLAEPMFSWMGHGKSGVILDSLLRALRYALLFAGFVAAARGATATDRHEAASGMRLAAKSLWLRLIAAAVVPLLTLMVIGSRGKGGIELLKVATISALVINLISFTQFGVGALRAARASVPELGRWSLVVGGSGSLFAAGVSLMQLPYVYQVLYKSDGLGFSGGADYIQALALAVPLIVIGGMAIIAVAIAGLGARRGNEILRADAQAKGAGFVVLSLVAIAISTWMAPDAKSLGSLAMMMLLALGAAVTALVMIARLLGLAADELDRDAPLPTASVVHGTHSP
jgi:hypothetical protein